MIPRLTILPRAHHVGLALALLNLLAPAALRATGGVPGTCIIDGVTFEQCPLGEDPLAPDGPGGGLLALDPDLSARGGGFILVPPQIAPGQEFTANAVIENFGGLNYSPTAIRVDFYLSPVGADALLPENLLGSTVIVFPVVTSATLGEVGVLVTLNGTLPEIASGQYRLAIDIDVDLDLDEVSEFNNAIAAGETIDVGGDPDLVPQLAGFNLSSPVQQGGTVTIASTVRNAGGGIAGPASFTVRYRAVPEGGDELGGTVLGEARVNVPGGTSFGAGASRAVPALEAEVGLPPGEFQIGVDVDFGGPNGAAGAIAESDERNNSLILGALVVQAVGLGPPDYKFLLADLASQEADPMGVGDRLFVDVRLEDPGPNLLPHIFPPITVVASEDRHIDVTDTTLRRFGQVESASGQSILTQPVRLVVPWPAGIPAGTYYVGAIIDPRNDIPIEPDKTNNTALIAQVTSEIRCPRLPKLGHAEVAFDELFTGQLPLPGGEFPVAPVEGAYCTGGIGDDFDFFKSQAVEDGCLFILPFFHARDYVETDLLPAMQRACVTTLSGLLTASRDDVLLARLAAFRLKDELASFKASCDADHAAFLHRRYCICPNPDFLSWTPPPHPGECFYLPNLIEPVFP